MWIGTSSGLFNSPFNTVTEQLWNFIDNTAFETQLNAEINPNEIDSDLELEAELNALDIENW